MDGSRYQVIPGALPGESSNHSIETIRNMQKDSRNEPTPHFLHRNHHGMRYLLLCRVPFSAVVSTSIIAQPTPSPDPEF
jgi:hypothetical protein